MEDQGTEKAQGGQPRIKDLMRVLEKQQVEINELKRERDAFRQFGQKIPKGSNSKIVRDDHPEPGGGYIVKMPTEWNGSRMGINFKLGVGIVDEGLDRCDEIAHWMQADYGYEVIPATEAEINKMRRMLDAAKIDESKKSIPEKLMQVGQM